MDKRHRIHRLDIVAIGHPVVSGEGDRYLVDLPAVTDGTKRARLLRVSMGMDGNDLRALLSAARAAGWTE